MTAPRTARVATFDQIPTALARMAQRLKLAAGADPSALVFGRSASSPFAPMAIGKRAKRCWTTAKLEPITLHQCRHTFASLLIDSGANPKAVQEFVGHSKVQTTFDVYGHLFPGSHDEVRARMDAHLTAQQERAEEAARAAVPASV